MADLTIGQRIAQERKKLNISQVGLATRLDVSRQAISKWESDAAIPEIDKLIALSRLFGVSIGWLLGVEDPAAPQEGTLTEDHYKIVEELVKKYQAPPKPHLTAFHYMFAIGASLLIFLFLYGSTSRLEKHILMYDASIATLSERLDALEAAPQAVAAPGQLLAGYSFDTYPLTLTKSSHQVRVSFSAVPHVWNQEDTGYLCISGGAQPIRVECSWDGSRLTAGVTLDVADGYGLSFAVEHPGGSQEQQLLEHKTIELLASACSIPLHVEPGSFSYQDGVLTFTDYTANLNLPLIYRDETQIPTITHCEYRLYRAVKNDSMYQQFSRDVRDLLRPSTTLEFVHQISGEDIRFENVDLKNCSHLLLQFYVKLSSGVEAEIPVTTLIPDGKGGLE